MRVWPLLAVGFGIAGCNPYMAAVSVISTSYGVATDERSMETQASDTEIETKIEADLLQSPVAGTGSLTVYCRQGVVLLAGVVPRGSSAGSAGVRIARATSGVRRVETFYVSDQPSKTDDLELEGKVKEAFVADPNLMARQVSVLAYGGHVALVGVVDGPEQIDAFVDDARGVSGVRSVRSFIQIKS